MAHIGSTEFYIKEECLPIEQFEEYTSLLFDRWDDFIGKSTNLPDYSIALDIEEGSQRSICTRTKGRRARTFRILARFLGSFFWEVQFLQR